LALAREYHYDALCKNPRSASPERCTEIHRDTHAPESIATDCCTGEHSTVVQWV
jgi:hypothetical protein